MYNRINNNGDGESKNFILLAVTIRGGESHTFITSNIIIKQIF